MTKGAVIYHGPSMLDGELIVAIATHNSANRKTGPMSQVWILSARAHPIAAAKAGQDASVCGGCPLRAAQPTLPALSGRGCYVDLAKAPASVYGAWARGAYESIPYAQLSAYGAHRSWRLGAYGDPAAVPYRVWSALLTLARGWTGYTHQHAHPRYDQRLTRLVMLSTQGSEPTPAGARTFRVRAPGAPIEAHEVECPNTSHGVSCIDCQLCQGTSKRARSVTIEAHGSGARFAVAS